jgi:hypothetical protein
MCSIEEWSYNGGVPTLLPNQSESDEKHAHHHAAYAAEASGLLVIAVVLLVLVVIRYWPYISWRAR